MSTTAQATATIANLDTLRHSSGGKSTAEIRAELQKTMQNLHH